MIKSIYTVSDLNRMFVYAWSEKTNEQVSKFGQRFVFAGPDPTPEILEIVTKNIVHHDALTYDYSFGEEEQNETTDI
jgi:hypothetical protein